MNPNDQLENRQDYNSQQHIQNHVLWFYNLKKSCKTYIIVSMIYNIRLVTWSKNPSFKIQCIDFKTWREYLETPCHNPKEMTVK